MLPVPFDQPITPIYTYGENNPPVIPNIQVHPDGMQLIASAAALLATKLGEAALVSPTRMFCYNIVSSNNWNTTDFTHLVRLVVDYSVYKSYTGGGGNIYVFLQQAVDEFASLYASYLAYSFQEYFVLLDPNTQNRVVQNVQLYENYSAKADSVMNMVPQTHGQMHHGRNQNMVMNRPQMHHGGHRPGAHAHYPAHTVHGGRRNTAVNPAASALVNQPQTMGRDPLVATKFGTVPRKVNTEIENNQGGNMDRSVHAIAYRGNTVTARTGGNIRPVASNRTTVTPPATQSKNKVSPEAQRRLNLVHEIDKDIDITDIIEPEIMTAFGTVDAIMSSKLKRSVLEIHPFVSLAIIPMIASTATDTLYNILREARTFTAVSAAMKKYKAILDAMDETKTEEKYFGEIWLQKVDNFITNESNRFFLSVFPNNGFSTTSIMEDGDELATMVDQSYGRTALNAFNQFQKNLFSVMFQSDAHGVDSIPELEDGDTKVIDYEIFTVKTLIAYLTASWPEINSGARSTRQIVTKDTICDIKETLIKVNALAKTTGVSRIYLMTTDGVKLAMFEDATEPGTFKLTEE